MSFDQEALFTRGQTFAGIGGPAPASTDGDVVEGYEKRFPDVNYSVGYGHPIRSGIYNDCRIMRNVSGINLLPMFLGNIKNGTFSQVDGYTITDGQRGVAIDEWLPTAGVQNNDLFWAVLRGYSQILTGLNADSTNVIAQGTKVTSLTTASSSQGTSAGRIKQAVYTGATAPLANEVGNFIGWAVSAATTANTGFALLVNIVNRN